MTSLNELKQHSDFKIMEMYGNGEYAGKVFSGGQVWAGYKQWIDKGLDTYDVYYMTDEPKQWEEKCSRNRKAMAETEKRALEILGG